jgi:hypothetical protein
MKRKIVCTSFFLLVIAILAIRVSGWEQATKGQDSDGRGAGPYVVGNGVKAPIKGVVLIQAIIRTDGTVDGYKVLPTPHFGVQVR